MSAPKLRFGEFKDDWQSHALGELCSTFKSGVGITSKHISESGLYPVYGGNGLRGFTDTYTHDGFYLLIGRQGALCGNVNTVKGKSYISEHAIAVQAKNTNSTKWLAYKLDLMKLNRLSESSAQPGLSVNKLIKIEVIAPAYEEQTKIANFLTTVDEKITQLTQKCELLAQYKNGIMQQIFSQQLRFKDDDGKDFPEWSEKKLGLISTITTGKSNREDSTVGSGAYTFFDRSQDIRTSDIYLFDCEAVIVAGEGQEFIPKHFMGKFDLHQRTYAIMDYKGVRGKYLLYFIYHHRHYFLSQAVGSTVKSLRLPMFEKMPINVPCEEEQLKIANFITAIDDKLTYTENQLAAVKQYKQGLLQQMFV